MIIEIFYHFCMLLTFTLLIYWPFINHFKQNAFIERSKSYVTGVKFGIAGSILTLSTIDPVYGFMISSRLILLLFSGLLGGPIAILISGLIMSLGQLIISDLTVGPFIVNLNFLILTILLFFLTRKFKLTDKTSFKYFWICFIEITIVLTIGLHINNQSIFYSVIYAIFTVFSFYFIYNLIQRVKRTSDTVQETIYLQRIDYPTQLPNNHAIEIYIQSLIKKKAPFNLLLLDIYHFKTINAEYGYQVGDEIIKQVAGFLQEYAKKNDAFVGRLAGEEFIVVLKDIAPAYAIIEASNLMAAIEKFSFRGPENEDVPISIAVGLSSYPDNGTDAQNLFKSLIAAQQHAKEHTHIPYFHANSLK